MINILNESLNFLFKEKDWPIKFFVPILLYIVFGVIMGVFFVAMFGVVGLTSSGTASNSDITAMMTGIGLLGIVGCCVIAVFVIISSVISLWYDYEYTQVGIYKRVSKIIWRENFGDILKKVLKNFLLTFIYYIPFTILFLCANFAMNLTFTGAAYGSSDAFWGQFLIAMCLMLGLYILLMLYSYFIVLPAKLRMIYTNTFKEGFNFKYNLRIVGKYFTKWLGLLGTIILIGIVVGMLYLVIWFISIIPCIGWIVSIMGIAVFWLFMLYFSSFMAPYLVGRVYREILESEGEIKSKA